MQALLMRQRPAVVAAAAARWPQRQQQQPRLASGRRQQQQQQQQLARLRPPGAIRAAAASTTAPPKQAAALVAAEQQQQQQQQQQQLEAVTQQQQQQPQQQEQQQQQPQQQEQPQQQPQQRQRSELEQAVRAAARAAAAAARAVDPRLRGLVLLNMMTLLMGTNWVVIKDSNSTFDPVLFTALRFTLAATAFAPFLVKGFRDPRVRSAGLEIGAFTALGYIAQSFALALTPASRASLLSTFTVLGVPCLAGLSGQKVRPIVWGCGVAALVGTAMLESGGGEPPNVGDALSVLSALFFAVQLFRTERRSRELPEGSALPLMAVVLGTVAAASCTAAAAVHYQDAAVAAQGLWRVVADGFASLGPGPNVGAAGAQPLYELFYTAFASTDLVLLIELVALQDVSSTEAALIYSLEPVSGAAMAYAFLGERWGPWGWVGAGVILAASVVTQLGGAIDEEGGGDGGSSGGGGGSSGGADGGGISDAAAAVAAPPSVQKANATL